MRSSLKWTLVAASTCCGILFAGLAISAQVKAGAAAVRVKLEAQKLANAQPIATTVSQASEGSAAAVAPLSQAELKSYQAELAKAVGQALLADAPYTLSLSQTRAGAGLYAKNANATIGFDTAQSFITLRRVQPAGVGWDFDNQAWLAAEHEVKPGYSYLLDFQIRDVSGSTPGSTSFKYLICGYNDANGVFAPCYYQGIVASYANGHLVFGYTPPPVAKAAVIIRPSVPKGVIAVTITPHKPG
jgi:hypothetical protein